MHTEWPVLGPDSAVEDAIRLFAERRISGSPVVEEGELLGIVTEGDLIFQDAEVHSPGFLEILGGVVPLGNWEEYREEALKSAGVTVREVMTENPVTVTLETPLPETATIMAEQGLKILPVMADESLAGVISRIDILTLHLLNPRQ